MLFLSSLFNTLAYYIMHNVKQTVKISSIFVAFLEKHELLHK